MIEGQFLHPKYLPTWLVIGLMRLVVFIPFKGQLLISKPIALILKLLLSNQLKIVRTNLHQCFPELDAKQHTDLVNRHFEAVAMSLFEIANCFYMSPKRLNKHYKFNNKEVLQSAIDDGKNIILIVGHFTTMVVAGRMLADNFCFADIYRPQNNKLFDREMIKQFTKCGIEMIKVKDSKKIIKTLKNKMPIWYAPDQDLRSSGAVFAPFFNIQTNTITATAKLAKISQAVLISYDYIRTDEGYELDFKLIPNFPVGNDVEDATTINQVIENKVKQAPEQYLWTHRRFKRRPDGEASFYDA